VPRPEPIAEAEYVHLGSHVSEVKGLGKQAHGQRDYLVSLQFLHPGAHSISLGSALTRSHLAHFARAHCTPHYCHPSLTSTNDLATSAPVLFTGPVLPPDVPVVCGDDGAAGRGDAGYDRGGQGAVSTCLKTQRVATKTSAEAQGMM
jgi:hypothetical protein